MTFAKQLRMVCTLEVLTKGAIWILQQGICIKCGTHSYHHKSTAVQVDIEFGGNNNAIDL